MIIMLEPGKHTVLPTDEYLKIEYSFEWKRCKGDPNVGKMYTRFMLPIRRKISLACGQNSAEFRQFDLCDKCLEQPAQLCLKCAEENSFPVENNTGAVKLWEEAFRCWHIPMNMHQWFQNNYDKISKMLEQAGENRL